VSIACVDTGGLVQQAPRSQVSFAERLNIAEFYFEGLDAPYNRELARLDELCRNRQDTQACRVTNLRPLSMLVALVHDAPSDTSEIVGELHAVLGFHPDYDLGYSLEFRPRGTPAKGVVWLQSVGDWGYGIEVPGVRIHGEWIQLFGAPLPPASWVEDRSSLSAQGGSIEGRLVSLPGLLATWPDGTERPITPGSYLIEQIQGSRVTFRAEVSTDFPCGEEVKPPVVMPPSLHATAQDFFNAAGAPLFSETYSRGC
jgi:hypothetical protein